MFRQRRMKERGATAIEYGLLAALVAVVIISVVTIMGGQLSTVFANASGAISGAGAAGEVLPTVPATVSVFDDTTLHGAEYYEGWIDSVVFDPDGHKFIAAAHGTMGQGSLGDPSFTCQRPDGTRYQGGWDGNGGYASGGWDTRNPGPQVYAGQSYCGNGARLHSLVWGSGGTPSWAVWTHGGTFTSPYAAG